MTPPPAAALRAPDGARGGRASARRPARPRPPLDSVPSVAPLTLTEPMPGFPEHRDYVLVMADGAGRLFWLQSVATDGPRFLAVAPAAWFPDYAPVLPTSVRVELGVDRAAAAELFCLVTVPGADPHAATVNLRAPVVVHATRRLARQVVLSDTGYPIQRPLRR